MTGELVCVRARFVCRFEVFPEVETWLVDFAKGTKLQAEDLLKLQLIVEELMTNSIRHGSCGDKSHIEIELRELEDRVLINYDDSGILFDPTIYSLPTPSTQTRSGYGWVLIRGFCHDIDYQRQDTINRTRLALPIQPRGPDLKP